MKYGINPFNKIAFLTVGEVTKCVQTIVRRVHGNIYIAKFVISDVTP